jgi:hypothetical protein
MMKFKKFDSILRDSSFDILRFALELLRKYEEVTNHPVKILSPPCDKA